MVQKRQMLIKLVLEMLACATFADGKHYRQYLSEEHFRT